ncbi:MAG: cache domain-containing protein [Desulfobacter sp.]|nr:MAG: cache domain-containing protein [Desulfobacter sp.]
MQPHSIRFKLIASLLAVSLFIGLLSLLVGGNLLYQSVLDEVNNRIRQDLNVAKVIYEGRTGSVRTALEITVSAPGFYAMAASGGPAEALRDINPLFRNLKLDFFGIVDVRRLCPGNPKNPGGPAGLNPLAAYVLKHRKGVSGTIVMTPEQLAHEAPALGDRADIRPLPARQDGMVGGNQEGRTGAGLPGLAIGAAVPIMKDGCMAGIIYGGFLLNGDTAIVDKINETVFENEVYKGRNLGTATIFYRDLRIATNVTDADGNRALGTTASPEVSRTVLEKGQRWTDRAKVLDDWYITAYEPITDIGGRRVGMFYVGVLEAKYRDVREKALAVFAAITLAGMAIAMGLGWLFTGRIMRPVSHLIRASAEISGGNFSPDIGPISKDDIGLLQKKFLSMTRALKRREHRQQVESQIQLIQSEKQASVGKLAAGVAHEINNPLTAVLTFTHLILRRKDLAQEVRSDLEIVAAQTERVRRIVKSLLDFSRQSALAPESTDLNRLISDTVRLMKNQALIKGIDLSFHRDDRLSPLTLDRNQFQSVLINIILNALDATGSGGKIELSVNPNSSEKGGAVIRISDTGCGIPPEHINRLFDPFFTTKDVGKGTGLGLAVSAGVIQRHGGTVKVRSAVGEGSTFIIRLPEKPAEKKTRER